MKKQNPLTIHTNGRIEQIRYRVKRVGFRSGDRVFPNLKILNSKKNQPKNKNQISFSANIITRFEQILIYNKFSKQQKNNSKSLPNQSHKFPNINKFQNSKKKFQIKPIYSQIKTLSKSKKKKIEQKSQQQISKSIRESQTLNLEEAAAWMLLWIGKWRRQLRVRDLREWGRRWAWDKTQASKLVPIPLMNFDLHLWQVARITVLSRGSLISSFVFLFLIAITGEVFWSFAPKSNDSHGFGLWHYEDRSERLWIYELSKRLRENGENEKMKWEKWEEKLLDTPGVH